MTRDEFTEALEQELRLRGVPFGRAGLQAFVADAWPLMAEAPDVPRWAGEFLAAMSPFILFRRVPEGIVSPSVGPDATRYVVIFDTPAAARAYVQSRYADDMWSIGRLSLPEFCEWLATMRRAGARFVRRDPDPATGAGPDVEIGLLLAEKCGELSEGRWT